MTILLNIPEALVFNLQMNCNTLYFRLVFFVAQVIQGGFCGFQDSYFPAKQMTQLAQSHLN